MIPQTQKLFLEHTKKYLINYLGAKPQDVVESKLHNPHCQHDLNYGAITYSIRVRNPMNMSKRYENLLWDFDLRDNFWIDGKTQKASKTSDPADYYILIGLVSNVPQRIFLIPTNKTPKSHLRISVNGKSKYHQYEI